VDPPSRSSSASWSPSMRRARDSTSTGHQFTASARPAALTSPSSARRRRSRGTRSSSYGRRAWNRCSWDWASCRSGSSAKLATRREVALNPRPWSSDTSPISTAQRWTNCSRYIASISSSLTTTIAGTTIWCIRGVWSRALPHPEGRQSHPPVPHHRYPLAWLASPPRVRRRRCSGVKEFGIDQSWNNLIMYLFTRKLRPQTKETLSHDENRTQPKLTNLPKSLWPNQRFPKTKNQKKKHSWPLLDNAKKKKANDVTIRKET